MLVSHRGGLSSGSSLIRMDSRQGGLSSGCSLTGVIVHKSCLSLIRVILNQGPLSLGWFFVRVVFHQGGLSTLGWSFIRVVSQQVVLSLGRSFTRGSTVQNIFFVSSQREQICSIQPPLPPPPRIVWFVCLLLVPIESTFVWLHLLAASAITPLMLYPATLDFSTHTCRAQNYNACRRSKFDTEKPVMKAHTHQVYTTTLVTPH